MGDKVQREVRWRVEIKVGRNWESGNPGGGPREFKREGQALEAKRMLEKTMPGAVRVLRVTSFYELVE
jgi:hypothetical protein